MRFTLEHLGYAFLGCGTGEDAIKIFDKEKPDVVMIDQGLPGMLGIEVGRQIRTNESKPQPILILFSGTKETQLQRNSAKAGFDAYLVKPIGMHELSARIESLMANREKTD